MRGYVPPPNEKCLKLERIKKSQIQEEEQTTCDIFKAT